MMRPILMACISVCMPFAGWMLSAKADLVITTNTIIALNQSTSDALQGLTATITTNAMTVSAGVATLTDATSATEPTASTYFNTDGIDGIVVFDLGETGANLRRLDRFDVWLPSNDPFRRNTRLQLAVSLNNVDYTPVADTGSVLLPAGNASQFNQVRLDFGADDVVGFQYVRVTGIPVAQPQDSTVRHPRWVELDAFTSAIPEPGTGLLLLTGLLLMVHRKFRRTF